MVSPFVFIAFDCLYVRGRDVPGKPLSYLLWKTSSRAPDSCTRLDGDGFEAFAEMKRSSEGLVKNSLERASGSLNLDPYEIDMVAGGDID